MFSHIQALRENQRQAGIAVVDHARDCSPHATAFLNFFTLVINKTATTLVTIVNTSYRQEIVAEQTFFAKKILWTSRENCTLRLVHGSLANASLKKII